MEKGFDFRFVIPVFINLLKYQSEALPWDWDAFNLVLNPHHTSWTKICFHVSLFLLLSSTSITLTITHLSPNAALIRFRFGNFSPHLTVSLVCSLVFPQAPFWFLYPAILVLNYFLVWVNAKLSALPVWNLHISSTLTRREQTNVDVESSQVSMSQVTIIASPEDHGDSLAEG